MNGQNGDENGKDKRDKKNRKSEKSGGDHQKNKIELIFEKQRKSEG